MRRSRRNKVEVIRGADGKLAGSRPQAQDRQVAAGRVDGLGVGSSRWPSNDELLTMDEYDALDVVEGVKEHLADMGADDRIDAAAKFDFLAVNHPSFQVRCSALESGWVSGAALDEVAQDGDTWVRLTAAQCATEWRDWFAEDESPMVRNAALHNPWCPDSATKQLIADPQVASIHRELGAPLPVG
jgi:hypothetical protein